MLLKRIYTLLFFGIASSQMVLSQQTSKVYFFYNTLNTIEPSIINSIKKEISFHSDNNIYKYIQDYVYTIIEKGYLLASVDSISRVNDSTYHAFVYLGNSYKWAKIKFNNISIGNLNKIGISKLDWEGKHISSRQLHTLLKKNYQLL
jgi:hypothetical protein